MNNAIRFWPRLTRWLPAVVLLAATASCTLRETHPEATAAREPQLQVRLVDEAHLGSLDVLPLHVPADVDLPRRNQLIAGYVAKQLPLHMRVQLNAYNPNPAPTAIVGLAYTVLLDGRPLGTGRQVATAHVPAGDSVRLPLTFELNTYRYLGEDALPMLRNFALGFGDLHRQRVTLQVRPLLRAPRGRLSSAIDGDSPAGATATASGRGAGDFSRLAQPD